MTIKERIYERPLEVDVMTREEIKAKLAGSLTPKRFIHSLNVMNTAVELAPKYDVDVDKAAVAGLLHDCARDIKGEEIFNLCRRFSIEVDFISSAQPELLHGPIGSYLARTEYGIQDDDIISAIYCHTVGRVNMTLLDKIVFIADYIEPNRNFPGVEEARKDAFSDLDKAVVYALNKTIKFVMAKGTFIHPETINARNDIIKINGRMPMSSGK